MVRNMYMTGFNGLYISRMENLCALAV